MTWPSPAASFLRLRLAQRFILRGCRRSPPLWWWSCCGGASCASMRLRPSCWVFCCFSSTSAVSRSSCRLSSPTWRTPTGSSEARRPQRTPRKPAISRRLLLTVHRQWAELPCPRESGLADRSVCASLWHVRRRNFQGDFGRKALRDRLRHARARASNGGKSHASIRGASLWRGATKLNEKRELPSRVSQPGMTDLPSDATRDISAALKGLLADVFVLYLKTKNFHWHMSGSHFRDYHLLLDEHGDQIFAMTDPIAERASQNRRNYAAVNRRDQPHTADSRQRRRIRRAAGYARRAP